MHVTEQHLKDKLTSKNIILQMAFLLAWWNWNDEKERKKLLSSVQARLGSLAQILEIPRLKDGEGRKLEEWLPVKGDFPNSGHRFPAPSSNLEGCRKPVLGVRGFPSLFKFSVALRPQRT